MENNITIFRYRVFAVEEFYKTIKPAKG